MANEIISEIILNLDTLRAQLKEAEGLGEKSGKSVGDSMAGAIGGGFGKVAAGLAAAAAALLAGFSLKKMIDEASETQMALSQLNGALGAAGQYSDAASARFVAFAEKMQSLSTVADDVIIKNGALLVSLGRLSGEGLERASKASLDLYAGLAGRIGVDQAFALVAKAADGNVSALSRFGVKVQETGDKTRDFANALTAINARFGGAAEREIHTFSGALAQMKNNFNDILKPLGELIIRSPVLVGILNFISQGLAKLGAAIREGIGEKDLLGGAIKSFLSFAVTITKYVLPPLELLYNLAKDVAEVLRTGVQVIIVSAATALQGLVEIAALVSDKFSGMRDTLREFVAAQNLQLTEFAQSTVDTFTNTLDFGLTTSFENSLANANTFVQGFGDKMSQLPKTLNAPLTEINNKLIQLQENIRKIVAGTLISIISNGIQNLGAALLRGSFSFADFKNFALNAMGDMSIRMGEAMIVQSKAFAALAALISNPFTAAGASIAFGILLIALGGVLKAAAGGGASGLGAGGAGAPGPLADTGGGISSSPNNSSTQAGDIERPQPGTNISVTVQGNILDRRQSGLEIAEIIQETFSSNGLVFATGRA